MHPDGCQIRDPHQRRKIVSEKIINGSLVPLAPYGRGLHPVGAVHGGVFFEEIFLFHAAGITLHGQWPSGEMRHQHGRDADVIIHHLPLGEPGSGIEDLVKVRETKLAALHFDDGRGGHKYSRWALVGSGWAFAGPRSSLADRPLAQTLSLALHPERLTTSDGLQLLIVASSSIVSRIHKRRSDA